MTPRRNRDYSPGRAGFRKLQVVVRLSFLVLVAPLYFATSSGRTSSDAVATIHGDHVITVNELRLHLAECDPSSGSDERRIECALRAATIAKLQQIEARKRGIAGEIDYQAFLRDLTAENARRAEVKGRGGVIYGPVRFSESTYYGYRMSNLAIRLREAMLADGTIPLQESRLRELYEQNKDTFRIPDTIAVEVMLLPAGAEPTRDVPGESPAIRLSKAGNRILDTFLPLVREGEGLRTRLLRFGPTRESGRESNEAEYERIARTVPPGQASEVATDPEGNAFFVRVTNRTENGFRSYEEVRASILRDYTIKEFHRFFEELAKAANVQINQAALGLVLTSTHGHLLDEQG